MSLEQVNKIVVVGTGLMGHGIALEFALAGFQVSVNDVDVAALDRGTSRIDESLALLKKCGMVEPDSADEALCRIRAETELDAAAAEADIVIEAVDEQLELKRDLFQRLDKLCPPHTIFASNSSSFTPSLMADATTRSQQFLGTHYFNPPYLIPLVEVIQGQQTSAETVQLMTSLLQQTGKTPVVVKKEVPGFVANRIQAAVWREILMLLADGVATAKDIDLVVKSSLGRRWAVAGPFEISDLAGLDLKQAILAEILPSLASASEVPTILSDMVAQGSLGVKSGEGFYPWAPDTVQQLRERIARALIAIDQWPESRT